MKILGLLIAVLLFSQLPSEAQQLECGTAAPATPLSPPSAPAGCSTPYVVTIAPHIVRTNGGTGGMALTQLDQAIADANGHFHDTGIVFQKLATVDFIDNNTYYDINNEAELDELRQLHVVADCINIYFVNTLVTTGDWCGLSSLPGEGVQGIVIRNDCTGVAGNHVAFSHELGHYFNLLHTHELRYGAELADGSNCGLAGDRLCDTPADPNLSGQVDGNCHYIGVGPDPNGNQYHPDVTQLMSYAPFSCTTQFSTQSKTRIRDSLFAYRMNLLTPVTITAPTGGPAWYIGTNQTISWSTLNGGCTVQQWEVIVEGVDENCDYQQFYHATLPASARTYQWTVQQSPFAPGLCPPLNARVVINAKDGNGAVISSASADVDIESLVSIITPTWGWAYAQETALTIGWFVAPNTAVTSQLLEESYDGGITWHTIASPAVGARSYDWTTPTFSYGYSKMRLTVNGTFPNSTLTSATWVTDWIVGQTGAHHGIISYNTSWSGNYSLDGDVKIAAGATLTILPGTQILISRTDAYNINPGYPGQVEIIVSGTLNVQVGNELASFRSSDPATTGYSWGGIILTGGTALIQRAEIRDAAYGFYAYTTTSSWTFYQCTFLLNSNDVYVAGDASPGKILNCSFDVGNGTGVQINGGTSASSILILDTILAGATNSTAGIVVNAADVAPTIRGCTISGFLGSSAYAVRLQNGNSILRSNNINNSTTGININGGQPIIGALGSGNQILSNGTGINVKCVMAGACPSCGIAAVARYNTIANNGIAVVNKAPLGIDLGNSSDAGYNNIYGSASPCITNSCSSTVPARGNYWGPAPCTACIGSENVDAGGSLCSPSMTVSVAPDRTALVGIHPNPFNPTTTVDFELKESAWTTISIYSVSGQLIRVESLGTQPAGQHNWVWRGTDQSGNSVSSGVYFVVLKAGTVTDKRKAVLLK
jgi:FlgD Ig-like domain/Right handed beta helix region